ncbi:uncharacterized protein LOC143646594 isoform X1 [Tamandua tetradactyla]|uniref:uncharacterized protein LOC143646594 isoform X1 n=1 Tax=Tamandua tetradactyla TaxID=48850 RepID=UPI004053E27C
MVEEPSPEILVHVGDGETRQFLHFLEPPAKSSPRSHEAKWRCRCTDWSAVAAGATFTACQPWDFGPVTQLLSAAWRRQQLPWRVDGGLRELMRWRCGLMWACWDAGAAGAAGASGRCKTDEGGPCGSHAPGTWSQMLHRPLHLSGPGACLYPLAKRVYDSIRQKAALGSGPAPFSGLQAVDWACLELSIPLCSPLEPQLTGARPLGGCLDSTARGDQQRPPCALEGGGSRATPPPPGGKSCHWGKPCLLPGPAAPTGAHPCARPPRLSPLRGKHPGGRLRGGGRPAAGR